jgi:hypothetical protein
MKTAIGAVLVLGLASAALADDARTPTLKLTGLKHYRSAVLVSKTQVTLPMFQQKKIQDSFVRVRCKSGVSRCIIKIEIEASLAGTGGSPAQICPLVDGNPLQVACSDELTLSTISARHAVMAFVSKKPGTSHRIGFHVFSSAIASTLDRFTATYTVLYK